LATSKEIDKTRESLNNGLVLSHPIVPTVVVGVLRTGTESLLELGNGLHIK